MRNKKIIVGFLLFCCIGSNVTAETLVNAVDAMRSGNFAEAFCIMRPLAEAGDADAQYNIGWMYLNGYGLRVDDRIALSWWQQASEQGHSDASFSIGMLYSLGEGEVSKNTDQAIDYYLLAADDGHEDSIAILKAMILRDDPSMRKRLNSIISDRKSMFGIERRVKARKLNIRNAPSTENKIIAQLLQDEKVLEVNRQGLWSQLVLLTNKNVDHTVWAYNPLLDN